MQSVPTWWLVMTRPSADTNSPEPPLLNLTEDCWTCSSQSCVASKPYLLFSSSFGGRLNSHMPSSACSGVSKEVPRRAADTVAAKGLRILIRRYMKSDRSASGVKRLCYAESSRYEYSSSAARRQYAVGRARDPTYRHCPHHQSPPRGRGHRGARERGIVRPHSASGY